MLKKVCDICNKDENKKEKFYRTTIESFIYGLIPILSFKKAIDLCPECHEKLVNFLKGKVVE